MNMQRSRPNMQCMQCKLNLTSKLCTVVFPRKEPRWSTCPAKPVSHTTLAFCLAMSRAQACSGQFPCMGECPIEAAYANDAVVMQVVQLGIARALRQRLVKEYPEATMAPRV